MKSALAVLLFVGVVTAHYYPYDYESDYRHHDDYVPVPRYSSWYDDQVYRGSRGGKKGYGALGYGGGGWGGWGGGLGIRYGWQPQLGWGGWQGWGAPQEHHYVGSPVLHLGGPPIIHQGPPRYVDTYYPVTYQRRKGWGWGGGGGGFGGGFGGGGGY